MIFKVSSRKLFIIVAQDQKERNGLELYVVISSSLSLLPDKNLLPRPIVFCYNICELFNKVTLNPENAENRLSFLNK